MENELSSYSTVWDARKRTFDNILNNLEVLRREVEDEKEEQDRKEGMNEGSDHEEEEGQVTGFQTPAVIKKVEETREREESLDSGEVDDDVKEQQASNLVTEVNTPLKDAEADMNVEDEDELKMIGADTRMDVD